MNKLPLTKAARRSWMTLIITLVIYLGLRPWTLAEGNPINQSWNYLLLNGCYLLDDCPQCDRFIAPQPMHGTFELRFLDSNPLITRYAVENINFKAGSTRIYTVKGGGTFQIGGEVAQVQQMFLQVQIDDGFTNKLCYFTNSTPTPGRPWPMLDITLVQTNGTLTQTYSLYLAAAPVREIWFSTVNPFTATKGGAPSTGIFGGDFLSNAGGVLKRNADLFTSVGAFPPAPDLGLDAVDMLPGAEIAFSLGRDIFSETLGQLHHGDLLSNKGRIMRRNQELLAPFLPDPTGTDVGLDAVQVLDGGEILFSIATNIFSTKLGVTLRRGDLLSSTGGIARSNQRLLSRFHPANTATDYGLDALYIWPGGEIWFSTEDGFQDNALGRILPGDLLSDQGYVVLTNRELLAAFAPSDTAIDFGLDALYVVTDITPAAPSAKLSLTAQSQTHNARLTWQGQGRVFQVEQAGLLTVPFQPLSPIVPDLSFDDSGALTNRSQGYYRLRQW